MKTSEKIGLGLALILTGIACSGFLEQPAFAFVKSVLSHNLGFLALVEEIKIILAGIGSLDIPFLSGHSANIIGSMGKAENFLLATSVLSFTQVMLISICKSWILKGILVVLLGLSILKATRSQARKFLVIALAINPGLPIYAIAIQELSKHAAIDFGDQYLTTLNTEVEAIRKEKTQLMKEHARNLVQIENGEKGLVFFRKLKEDISYDFHKAEDTIKGDYTHIRILVHDAGYGIMSRIFGFCSMVLFSMLLLPLGYSLFVYILFQGLFKGTRLESLLESKLPALIPQTVSGLNNLKTDARNEFQHFENAAEQAADKVTSTYETIKTKAADLPGEVVDQARNFVDEQLTRMQEEVRAHIEQEKANSLNVLNQLKSDISKKFSDTHQTLFSGLTDKIGAEYGDIRQKIEATVLSHSDQVKQEIGAHLEKERAAQVEQLSAIKTWASNEIRKATADATTQAAQVLSAVKNTVESTGGESIAQESAPAPQVTRRDDRPVVTM